MKRLTLKEYLFLTDQAPYLFAKDAKISKDSVYKHLNGEPVSRLVADRISLGTGRKVRVETVYKTGRA